MQTPKVHWSPSLKLESLTAIDNRLTQPFGDAFQGTAHGQKANINTCNDYLRLAPQGFRTDSVTAARILHVNAVDCVALNLLRSAKAPLAMAQPEFQLTAGSLSILPPELAPAISNELIAAAKTADLQGKSWKTYIPSATATVLGPERIAVSQPGWRTLLTVYARGDFSGNGEEQYLIRADYHAQQGTYGNSTLYLLAPPKPGAQRLQFIREVAIP